MIVKRLRPIYRLGRRPIINGIKSKPSALIPERISNPVWMRHVDFYSGKYQRHKSLTVNTDLALKNQTKSLRQIACDALEAAS